MAPEAISKIERKISAFNSNRTNGKTKKNTSRNTHAKVFLLQIFCDFSLWALTYFESLEKYETILWLPKLHFTVLMCFRLMRFLFVSFSILLYCHTFQSLRFQKTSKQIAIIGSSFGLSRFEQEIEFDHRQQTTEIMKTRHINDRKNDAILYKSIDRSSFDERSYRSILKMG